MHLRNFVLATSLSLLNFSVATPIYHRNGTVEIPLPSQDGLEKRSVTLHGFDGCEGDKIGQITNAWDQMIKMSNVIKGTIDFNGEVS